MQQLWPVGVVFIERFVVKDDSILILTASLKVACRRHYCTSPLNRDKKDKS